MLSICGVLLHLRLFTVVGYVECVVWRLMIFKNICMKVEIMNEDLGQLHIENGTSNVQQTMRNGCTLNTTYYICLNTMLNDIFKCLYKEEKLY